jgi:tRNA A-37 threonylcarbamoyl transferase component Bud32
MSIRNLPTSHDGRIVYADPSARHWLSDRIDTLNQREPPGWQRVKHNASRTVYRGRIDGQSLYLKQYHGQSIGHRLQRLMGRSDALRELRFSRYLRDRDVPTAEALAASLGGSCDWLLTRAVEPAEPADTFHARLQENDPDECRTLRRTTAAVGRLIGRMHAAGVVHWDLHCGNILLKTDTRTPQPVLMDLHRMSRHRWLSRRTRARNLAQLFHDRQYFTSRTDRLRCLKHYLQASGAKGSLRGWIYYINIFARRHTLKQYAQRDKRITGRNRYFSPIRTDGWKGHVVLASKRKLGGSRAARMVFTPEQWQQALADPDALFVGEGVDVIKNTRSGMVARRMLRLGDNEIDVFIKRPKRKNWLKILLSAFRRSRPMRNFKLGHDLLTRRIATALPLAALERRVGPFLADTILITEAVPAPNLYDFMNTWLSVPPKGDTNLSEAQQRHLAQEVLWQLGRLLQQLHDNHFAHRDLKATNIRVRWNPGIRPEIVLVDLDGLSRVRFITAQRKLRGLMRLNVSLLQCPVVNHAGRLRMLLGYMRRPGSGRINFKPIWRVLENWSARKLNQQIRDRRKRQKKVRRPA